MDKNIWGNLCGKPLQLIEETHENNFVNVLIYQVGDSFTYGYQLRVGTIIRQKAANVDSAKYKSIGKAREAAGNEIQAICNTNKNSKKYFAEFKKICYIDSELFGGIYG